MESNELESLFRAFRERSDLGALATVFERTAPDLLRTATSLAGDPSAGEDLLQATFVSAIERRERWDAGRPLVPWLVGILTRHARELRRRAARAVDPERLGGPRTRAPEAASLADEVQRALAGSTEDLPDEVRQVVVLHLRHDLAPAAIAEALGRSPSTVRSQLQRGLARLRERLPRGVVPASALVLAEPRGLAAIEASVLERARHAVAPPAPAPTAARIPQGAPMLKLTACTLAVTGALVLAARTPDPATHPVEPPRSSVAAAEDAPVPPAALAALAPRPSPVSGPSAGVSRDDVAASAKDARPAPDWVLGVVVVDPHGAPVVGARVELEGVRLAEEPESLYGWRADAVEVGETDADGAAQLVIPFEWDGKHPDAVSVSVHHRDFAPSCSDLVELARGRVEIALEWGAVLRVAGYVGSGDGEPGGARRVRGLRAELGPRSGVEPSDWTELGDGRLATAGLAPGEHQLVLAWSDGAGRRHESAFTTFELEAGGELDLALELVPTARVVGRLAPEVPRPVAGGEVVAHRTSGGERMLTRTLRAAVAADGTFVLHAVGPGALEVAVLADGWTSASPARGVQPTAQVAGRDVELVVPMVRTGALDLVFRGPAGEPAAGVGVGVSVPVYWGDGRWQYFERGLGGETDAEGRLRVSHVPPGRPRIFALHPELRIDGPIPLTSETTLEGGPLRAGETRAATIDLVRK